MWKLVVEGDRQRTVSKLVRGEKEKSGAGWEGSRDVEKGTSEQRLKGDKGVGHVDVKIKCKAGGTLAPACISRGAYRDFLV